MKMCKYCGGLVDVPTGTRGMFCSKQCWDAVEGFDKTLELERKSGKSSLDAIISHGGDVSDGGKAAADIRLGTHELISEALAVAVEIHPLLPSALMLIAGGATQRRAAERVGLKQAHLSMYIRQLRKTLSGKR